MCRGGEGEEVGEPGGSITLRLNLWQVEYKANSAQSMELEAGKESGLLTWLGAGRVDWGQTLKAASEEMSQQQANRSGSEQTQQG